jgi:hypothetical protein
VAVTHSVRCEPVKALHGGGSIGISPKGSDRIEEGDKVAMPLDLATLGMDFADALHLVMLRERLSDMLSIA